MVVVSLKEVADARHYELLELFDSSLNFSRKAKRSIYSNSTSILHSIVQTFKIFEIFESYTGPDGITDFAFELFNICTRLDQKLLKKLQDLKPSFFAIF